VYYQDILVIKLREL